MNYILHQIYLTAVHSFEDEGVKFKNLSKIYVALIPTKSNLILLFS